MPRKNRVVGFGLSPTPADEAPWGVFGGTDEDGRDASKALDKYVRRGGDQEVTNTCVWWAIAQALWVSLGSEGFDQRWASVLGGYYPTRMRTHGGDKSKIHDLVGCRPTDAANVVREVGVMSDRVWPFDASKVDEEPPYDALVAGDDDWFSLRRIIVPEGDRGQSLRHVVDNLRKPVLIGHDVNQEYIDWEPGDIPWTISLGGPVKGKHMELIATYNRIGPLTVSSWGDMYDRQLAWKQVESDHVHEFWYPVVDVARAAKVLSGGGW